MMYLFQNIFLSLYAFSLYFFLLLLLLFHFIISVFYGLLFCCSKQLMVNLCCLFIYNFILRSNSHY